MSREQRRSNRRQQTRSGAAAPRTVNRRTPVKAPGASGPPWALIGVAGGGLAIVLLIVYLIVQSMGGDDGLADWEKAQMDDRPELPGLFFPTQGRQHFNYTYDRERDPRPFCAGVRSSESDSATPPTTATATATATPPPTSTPEAQSTGTASPSATATPRTDCYATNPPSSGDHLGVQRNVDLGNGARINIPADPDVYPEDVIVPREAIPHILEHAGVFVGYHCAAGDADCLAVVDDVKGLVNDRIDNHNDRVVMANDPDLPVGEFGVASWTRVMNFRYQDYDEGEVRRFIDTHSCRFDPEGFCN